MSETESPRPPESSTSGASDAEVLAAVRKMLALRSQRMAEVLDATASEELNGNLHLDEGTRERAYWHAGYVTALRDVLRLVDRRITDYPLAEPV